MGRVLEKEVMESAEEAKGYDELDRLWGDVLFQGFAESATRMGVVEGRVLDVGCGPGRISVRLAKLNANFAIDAIDLSQNMLDLGAQTAAREGVANSIKYSIGDAKAIPFADHTFDLVICHNFLHQLPEPIVTVKEINRVAKKAGAILIRDVRRLAEPLMSALLPLYCLGDGNVLRRLTYDSYFAGLTYREFVEMPRKASVEKMKIRPYFLTHVGMERTAIPFRTFTAKSRTDSSSIFRRALKSLYLSNLPNK